MTIYAIQGRDNADRIFESLQHGEGRFGWSYVETANQRDLTDRFRQDGWESLNSKEKDCYHGFLLGIEPDDYVVYINVPVWGKCTLAKVTGGYFWRFDDNDFNHRFRVSAESVHEFNRNDAMVPPALKARLKLRQRWWTIRKEEEFRQLLSALKAGTTPAPSTLETNLQYLSENLEPLLSQITNKIQDSHPNKDLEPFIEMIFRNVPGVESVRPKKGQADHGADLLVDFESELMPGLVKRETMVVQVKSYEGRHVKTSAVNDIKRAFEYYENNENVTMGMIISTATEAGEELISELDKLREDSGKPVAILIGTELAKFVLKYVGDILK